MTDASNVTKVLAEKMLAENSTLDNAFERPRPKQEVRQYATSGTRPRPQDDHVWRPAPLEPKRVSRYGAGKGDVVTVAGHELRKKPLWPGETASLDDKPKARPSRDRIQLGLDDWDALAAVTVTRSMTFDDWLAEAAIDPLVKDYDDDYAAAARLYLARKSERHQRRK